MTAIRHRMADGSPDCAKIRLTFRFFFSFRSCFQTKNLLWLNCRSRFFYKLNGRAARKQHARFRLSKKGIRLADCTKCQQVGQAPGDGMARPSEVWPGDWSGRYLARCGGRFFFFVVRAGRGGAEYFAHCDGRRGLRPTTRDFSRKIE